MTRYDKITVCYSLMSLLVECCPILHSEIFCDVLGLGGAPTMRHGSHLSGRGGSLRGQTLGPGCFMMFPEIWYVSIDFYGFWVPNVLEISAEAC